MERGGIMNKKNKKQKLILILIFTVGLSIFLYPIISDAINSRHQTYAVNRYEEEAAKISQQEKEKIKEEAQAFNQSLQVDSLEAGDPFSGEKTEETAVSYIDMLSLGETLGHIEIPKINVDLPIYRGISEKVLQKGIGYIEQSSLPIGGVNTNTILTGHRGLPTSKLFTDLDKVEIGDMFYVHTLGDILAYKVIETKVVLPTDIEKLNIRKGKDLTTLITCTPYMINSHRLLVIGERIPYAAKEGTINAEITVESSETIVRSAIASKWMYAAFSIIIMVGTVIFVLMRKKGRLPGGSK